MSANQSGVASVSVKLRVNNTPEILRQVRLYGPSDITGVDAQQVIRTEPRNVAMDFEPNYFPAIEFDRPDFPWIFTPAKADASGKLRPWLCLVVVRKQDGVTLRVDRNLPLPVLDIKAPARPGSELPDLSESWAWAHAQVTGSPRDNALLKAALAGDPALTASRLLCPRRLDPATEYLACVVPAFDSGCKAGLGATILPADEKLLAPAWKSGAQSPPQVTLPVYFHWEFRTGTGHDFESLAALLEPRKMPEEVGKRRVDISEPAFQINPPLLAGTMIELEGALRVLDAPTAEWPKDIRARFQTELKKILDAPWLAMKQENKEPLVAPPIYGCWQAARHTVEITAPVSTPWLDELNLDPRHRTVAAFGTAVVQTQQEPLMASAWEQLGEIERINQMRRQAQLGRAVNAVYHARHFARFSEETLLKVVASAQSRVVVEVSGPGNVKSQLLLSQRISQSAIPDRIVSAPMRRLTSPRSPIHARFQAVGPPPITMMKMLNTAIIAQPKGAGWVTINQVSDQAGAPLQQAVRFEQASTALDMAPQLGKFQVAAEGNQAALLTALIDPTFIAQSRPPDSPDARAFRNAARAHQDYIEQKVFLTVWHNCKHVFSGGNGIIYGVDSKGRLLFYRDKTQDGTGDVVKPSVIGLGGWQNFKFLFSGGNGIIYAVEPEGRLLFYRDKTQDGTGSVANPSVIGLGGWQNFKFVFSGGNGIIYAVNPEGRLLFYRDKTQNGTGDVANPSIIGLGGWQTLKLLFSSGNGTLYAVDQEGKLLFSRDNTQNGTGLVLFPSVIGSGGWQNFKFVFSGGNGIIYAVDQEGRLLFSRDKTQDGIGQIATPSVPGPAGMIPAPPINLSDTRDKLLQSVNPEKTINARVQASLVIAPGAAQTGDPLEPILDTPEFPQPMYEALRDLSQDFLFPGLEHVPPNTITLLQTNPKFVESFMVGLNAEMSHELLWRNYPTDQRGTYFRHFWDTDNGQPDINIISKWGDRKLGQNAVTGEQLVLLIRGELLRRYPNSVIYAVRAVREGEQLKLSSKPAVESHPLFRGTLKPDITFLGFALKKEEAIADPGWFFVIQQQPTEPCFGMDVANFKDPLPQLTEWNKLSWRHLVTTEEELKALSHASIKTVLKTVPPDIDKASWGGNSAHMAYITLQRPVRIAIHARDMLAERSGAIHAHP